MEMNSQQRRMSAGRTPKRSSTVRASLASSRRSSASPSPSA
jgi:hypothetical protein